MSDEDERDGRSAAKGVAAFVAVVLAVNVLVRLVGVPDVDLPAVTLPDLPDWVGTAVRIKNWLLIGVVAVVAIGVAVAAVLEERGKREDR